MNKEIYPNFNGIIRDYDALKNKPTIDGVEIEGDITASENYVDSAPTEGSKKLITSGAVHNAFEHSHEDFYKKKETDALLDTKAPREHSHDERYYTEAETDILLFGKSDKEHSHGEFYTKEETGALLDTKAEKEHSHQYSSLSEKPGDKIFEDLVLYDLLPVFTPIENSDVTGKMFPFTHNIKGYVNTSLLTLEYKVPDCPIILGQQRFINFEPLSDGGYFIPFGKAVSCADFFLSGFGEISPDTLAAAVILSSDGTGKIYIRNDIEGISAKLSIKNALTGYVKLPMEAVDYTEKAEENDKRLITSGGVHNAIAEELGKLPEIPENVSAFKNDVGYLTEHQSLAEYPKRTETEKHTADAVSAHNVNESAHQDIRLLLQGLSERINAVLDSDDTTLDQLSEIVAYIKSNKELIDAVTTKKISYSDIINNLETNVSNKPLSAAMGVALKALIDAIVVPTKVSQLQNDSNFIDGEALKKEVSEALPLYITATADFKSNTVTGFSVSPDEIFEAVKSGRQVILAAEIEGTFLEDIPDGILTMPLIAYYDGSYALFTAVVDETEYRIFAAKHDMGDGTYQTALFATCYSLAGKGELTALSGRVTALEEAGSESSDGICHIGAFLTMDENGSFILKDVESTVSEMLILAAENKAVVLDIALDGDYEGDWGVSVPLTLSSQNEEFLCFNSVIDIDTMPSFLRVFGRANEGADSWTTELIPLEVSQEEAPKLFVITATADFQNMVLTDVSHSFAEVSEAYARKDHIFLDLDISQMSDGQRFQVALNSITEDFMNFETIINLDGGKQSVHLMGIIYSDGHSSFAMIPLVQSTQLGGLTFVTSDTVPTVDDRSIITFVIEE